MESGDVECNRCYTEKITHVNMTEVGDKIKQDASGKVINNKAGLVARRYVDKHGIDLEKLFAPLTRLETLSPLVALATKNQLITWTLSRFF